MMGEKKIAPGPNKKVSKGFTLVEVFMAVVLAVFFSGFAISSYFQARSHFALSQAAHRFAQDARRAQQMALASQVYKDSGGTIRTVDRYGIHVNTSQGKRYDIFADNSATPAAMDYIVETVDFTSTNPGVIIKSIDGVTSSERHAYFLFPNGKAVLGDFVVFPDTMDVVFALENDLATVKTVSINSAGLVEVK